MANRPRRSRSAGRKRRSRALAATPKRAHIVWASFVASMTVVGGLLLALESSPSPRVDGRSLAPLVAADGPTDVASVFNTTVALKRDTWKSIVIHHSGSPVSSPESIAAEHEALGGKGMGHHFVIGNGSGRLRDGELYVNFRWYDQLPGFHAAGEQGDWHNRHSISICLVGDGNRRPFTAAQMDRLDQLVTALSRELGIAPDRVHLHSELAPTADPGRLFPAELFRQRLARSR